MLSGLVLSALVAALVLLGRGSRDMLRSGLARTNYAGRRVAFPAGAALVACSLIALVPLAVVDDRADLDLLDPELRRWIVYVLGVAMLGLLDDALGRGAAADTPRGWRGHAARGARRALLDRRDQGGRRARARRLRGLGPRPRGDRLRRRPRPAAAGDQPLQPARPAPGPGREGVRRAARRASASGPGPLAPLELLGLFIGPVLVGAAFTLRERAMLGDTGSNLVGALAGISLLVTLGDTGRWIALALVAALTIYGEFRSISETIESVPPLRWLDSLGRVKTG